MLAQIAEEVDKTRELTRTVLPARISERRARLSKVRDAIADPNLASDADLAPLASRVNALADETRELGDNTALHWAAMRGHVEIVNLLLQNGADKNIKNKQENLPIDLCKAIWSNSYKYVREILSH